MKVLVITRAPWRNDNNTGNTLTNLFCEMDDIEFYSIHLRDQVPDNAITARSFSISERQLLNNLFKKTVVGKEIFANDKTEAMMEENIYSFAKKKGNMFLVWLRDVLWSFGQWKNDNLKNFIKDINPDVIFMPMFCCVYPYRVIHYISKITKAKIILFHPDDNYTLKQFSLSPIFWLYRFNLRKWVKKIVNISDVNYAISHIQKEEYEKALNIENSSKIMGFVDSSEVASIQSNADMLIHVEAMDLKNKLLVRQSFSTKIVDYFKSARPILAVGPKDVASIDHLIRNDCAIVADNKQELVEKLTECINNNNKLTEIAVKGYECGKKHHNKENIDNMLIEDLKIQ